MEARGGCGAQEGGTEGRRGGAHTRQHSATQGAIAGACVELPRRLQLGVDLRCCGRGPCIVTDGDVWLGLTSAGGGEGDLAGAAGPMGSEYVKLVLALAPCSAMAALS